MKTLSSLKSQLVAHKKAKKELEKSLIDENLFNKRSIFIRIRKRITDPKDKILGVVEGNLAYVKLKFEIHPNIGIPLSTRKIEQSLTLAHNFLRKNLLLMLNYCCRPLMLCKNYATKSILKYWFYVELLLGGCVKSRCEVISVKLLFCCVELFCVVVKILVSEQKIYEEY